MFEQAGARARMCSLLRPIHLMHVSIGDSFENPTNPGVIVIEWETVVRPGKDLSF